MDFWRRILRYAGAPCTLAS
ncbi:unnamed protein product [Victoria cruziana]